MRARTLAALGAAAYLVFLVATVPAGFVTSRLQAIAPGPYEVEDAQGTVWHGAARARIATPAGPLAIDRIAWRFLPQRLVAGRLAFALTATGAGIDGRVELARDGSGWQVRDLHASGDVAPVAALAPLLATWHPEGRWTATAPALAWNAREVRGNVHVEWRAAGTSLSAVRPLGSYGADAQAEGGSVRFTVATLDGPLRISGRGTFAPPSRVDFTGEARAEPAAARALDPLLDLLGPRRADGARTLEWHGAAR